MDILKYTIPPHLTVKEAIQAIDTIGKKVVLIVDETSKLLGIFSDGDMRKYILKNGDLKVAVGQVMNTKPIVFKTYQEVEKYKRQSKMVVYPIVNDKGLLIDVVFWNDEDKQKKISEGLREVQVVIMAGGKGTRLYPYTKILPKPLIPVGDLTITERIIERFTCYGCKDFKLVLNYKGNMIKAYFNELEKSYEIGYVQEKDFLGTGGGLSLLKGQMNNTFFVSNCDTLIDADYECIYKFHTERKNKITLICALKNMTVPYGVVSLNEQGDIIEFLEKPSFSFLTNTGLYLLEPEVLESIEEGMFKHLTDIVKEYIKQGENVGVYPISEKSWLDMGQLVELEEMFESLGIKG